jgi:perosamine synthetase
LQPAYRGRLGDVGSYPAAEQAAREVLSLPLHPALSEADVNLVVQAIIDFFRETGK